MDTVTIVVWGQPIKYEAKPVRKSKSVVWLRRTGIDRTLPPHWFFIDTWRDAVREQYKAVR